MEAEKIMVGRGLAVVSGVVLVALAGGCHGTPLCEGASKCHGNEQPDRPPEDARIKGALPDHTLPLAPRPHGGSPNAANVRAEYPYVPLDAGAFAARRALLNADSVQLDGERVLAVSEQSVLSIVDVADLAHPKLQGELNLRDSRERQGPGAPLAVHLRGTTAIVVRNNVQIPFETAPPGPPQTRIQLIDVSNPAAPAVRHSISPRVSAPVTLAESPLDVDLRDDRATLALGAAGVRSLDL